MSEMRFPRQIKKFRDIDFFELSRSRLSRPENFSGQSRLSRGTGQTGFFGIRDCPAGLYFFHIEQKNSKERNKFYITK
jgi:hypothetical protein